MVLEILLFLLDLWTLCHHFVLEYQMAHLALQVLKDQLAHLVLLVQVAHLDHWFLLVLLALVGPYLQWDLVILDLH